MKRIGFHKEYRFYSLVMACLFIFSFMEAETAYGARVKDIATVHGVRSNQLVGYGLVVGLNGTGDDKKSIFLIQSLSSMLEKMGITVDPRSIDKVENVATVMVTAELPPFAKQGARIDVLVSSLGDADDLQGGTLLYTALRAADGDIYAVAQGPVSTGGFTAGGAGAKVQKNFPTVARVVNGGLIEREAPSRFGKMDSITLILNQPDFTTATRLVDAINQELHHIAARARDGGTVDVDIPETYSGRVVELVTLLEGLNVQPDQVAKVIINERTGTIVMGDKVRISTIALAHGNLSIELKEQPQVSQPLPFSGGETVVTPDTQIVVREEKNPVFLVDPGVTIGDLVKALNALGLTPRDLIAIFQAIKAAGALQAELEIM